MKKAILSLFSVFLIGCQSKSQNVVLPKMNTNKEIININMEVATFAGGCFWCTEAVFLELKGVETVVSGYIGGTVENPTYEQICTGKTGHAEAIQITFDSTIISFGELLEIFFATHDPTTLNQQGADRGTQYRSEVFYNNENQKEITLAYIALMFKEKTFNDPIVTAVSAATKFYGAENYHQNYYNQNKQQSYCSYVITPKVEKVRKLFSKKLK
jgi:peptide-methionine (S)-S-oxide reductase